MDVNAAQRLLPNMTYSGSSFLGNCNQDSDVDSGIVACSESGQRTGSTSSTDTDSGQELSKGKDNAHGAVFKLVRDERHSSSYLSSTERENPEAGAFRIFETDHSSVTDCNRRPPTPLSVFGNGGRYRRPDDQLYLSQQTLRRSCRKLFATLYAQKFSASSFKKDEIPTDDITTTCLSGHVAEDGVQGRARSRTLSDLELRKYAWIMLSDRRHPYWNKTPCVNLGNNTNKEYVESSIRCRKAVTWNVKNSCHRRTGHVFCDEGKSDSFSSVFCDGRNLGVSSCHHSKAPAFSEVKSATDSNIAENYQHPYKESQYGSRKEYSSQLPTSPPYSSRYAYVHEHCCYCCCCCYDVHPYPLPDGANPSLSKSVSCSTLPGATPNDYVRPAAWVGGRPEISIPYPLQKTSSCSSLQNVEKLVNLSRVTPCKDTMMHVYAHLASVVPEEPPSSKEIDESLSEKMPSPNLYPYSDHRKFNSSAETSERKDNVYDAHRGNTEASSLVPSAQKAARVGWEAKPYRNQRRLFAASDGPEVEISNHSSLINQKSGASDADDGALRPTTVRLQYRDPHQRRFCAQKAVPRITMEQNELRHARDSNLSKDTGEEVEYAVVDKSKKNKFTSLPFLNRYSTSNLPDEQREQPPVPPKKNLHRSDFSLGGKETSPKRGFLEKFHDLTRSARNAFHKAFSAERIYCPEKEERLEATGNKLRRSRSFMKGIRASISRKRKKPKPLMAEVVPQASSNPSWDEVSSSENSPVHVRGQLLQLNLDGSQVVELSKPPNKPFGFFVARGRVRNSKGVFVSRMRDQETQKLLAGLLDIGDEILEVDGMDVRNADIMEVNNLMLRKNTLLLTVLPYICRKDI